MAEQSATTAPLEAPIITQADLQAFHTAHFSAPCVDHFAAHFLGPVEEDEEDDDGLGYYPDGVKRTLTDEQILMFRHSEIQTLLRERRHREESADEDKKLVDSTVHPQVGKERLHNPYSLSEDGEISQQQFVQPRRKKSKHNNRSKKSNGQGQKPDLRKRTWDKVEMGLESLDYGEEDYAPSPRSDSVPQRKRISYDDS